MTIRWNWMQNGSYSAQNDRQLVAAMWDGGIQQGLKPVPSATTRSVDIPAGRCVIEGNDTTGQGSYLVTNDATVTVGLSAPPGSLNRLDLIYIRVQDSIAGGPAGDNAVIGVVTGTASSSPAVPTLPTSALALATALVTPTTAVLNPSDMAYTVRVYGGPREAVGVVKLFHGPSSRIPNRWAECGGAALGSVASFPDYAEFIGQTSGTIVLPDFRDRVPLGVGGTQATSPGSAGGAFQEQLTSLHIPLSGTANENMNHQHGIDDLKVVPVIASTIESSTSRIFNLVSREIDNAGYKVADIASVTGGITVDHQHPFGFANPTALSKMQPWIGSRYIIRVAA